MKKFVAGLLAFSFFVGCSGPTQSAPQEETNNDNWKIGVYTGTVAQNEEEFRAAQAVLEKYGEDRVIHQTYPEKFMDEQETVIANLESMATDPDVKAIVICQAIPGTSAAIDKIKESRDDILFIAGTPGEDPGMIGSRADIVLMADELGMGTAVIQQAKKQGADTFVHYSFPRHMSYALLAARRDLFKAEAEKQGIKFVDATAPDPTSDAGVSGAQQFILEDVPRKVEEYGENTAFFSTNCSMQPPLIKQVFETGAIYPQPCCPSPYHGFPSALEVNIPEEKQGDIDFVIAQITETVSNHDMSGRMSTWPVPVAMMFIEAGADYAVDYIENGFDKVDDDKLNDHFATYISKYGENIGVKITNLEENGETYDNYKMVLMDFLNF